MDDPHSSTLSYSFSMLVLSLIFASTITFVLETVPSIRQSGSHVLFGIEAFCIAVFTLEVLLRLVSTPSCSGYFKDTFNWIDIISIIPFYVELAIPASGASSIGLVRVVRLVRVARIVKVSRYSQSIRIFSSAMLSSLRPLMMLVFLVSIAMVMFSSGLYFAELTDDGCRAGGWTDETRSLAQLGVITCDPRLPEWTQLNSNGTFRFQKGATDVVLACVCTDPNPFQSIPATFWWCIVTMTTVGFGDEVPVTAGGRVVAVVTMISGIIILALPITVIGTNFSRVLREIQQERMLNELNRIDRDGDGLVDEEELALMIQHMAAVAGDLPKELIPDAKTLLRKYDVDGTGALTKDEVNRLRADMHGILGSPDTPAGDPDGSHEPGAEASEGGSRRWIGDEDDGVERGGGASPGEPAASSPPQSAAGDQDAPGAFEGGWGPPAAAGSLKEAVPPQDGLRRRQGAGGAEAGSALTSMGPAALAVVARLEEIEDRVDDKLVSIIDLLRKMNAAVASGTGSDAVV
ncbi:hypothetical protein FNF27_07591 [Cafeteria roenbergensis]|nr:hypothetical protein FNF28_07656 [Cafeteria roenbergensis]KAA0147802.1 hypothetical protein FNF29_07146 [Cafeteria roenbergensis]KAA0164061.1 hypothetical protein FNF31_02610 [Cafeteria roenbergensis]KAA0165675.1 hypothetical protein FNF27_07591 [Cafeteria roenbergensis]|eukprot:KAA0147802.1 hypothetical protein FNF29_07146 [Cafeteria roenbergensis]